MDELNAPMRWLDDAMDFVVTPLWKWPLPWRRVFLCTYPIAMPLRWCAFLVLLVGMMVAVFSRDIGNYIRKVWNGQRPGF